LPPGWMRVAVLLLTPTNTPTHLHDDAPIDQHALRSELQHQREFRRLQLDELEATISSASGFSPDAPQHQVILDLHSAATIALIEIDAALNRMKVGTYGKCGRCRSTIPHERLAALPMVRLCMACQAADERRMLRDAARTRLG
jgi:RNA polymerase-binding transcription factor DksA